MGEGEGGLDKRVEFVLRRIFAVFGYSKYDKFKSTILNQKEDSPLRAIETFLDDPECTAFFAYQGSGESLAATTQSPGSVAQIKKKAEVEISADNMVDCIIVQELSKRLLENINSLLNGAFEGWEADCVDSAKEKLKMRLLRRLEKTGTLKVNFDPQLVRLLREVRYFLLFGLEVPEAALEMYQRANTYREWTGRLDVVVQKYNSVLTELLPVEEPLFADRIQKMDTTLSPGLVDLRWHREDQIPDFIALAEGVIGDVSSVVDVVKSNLRKISAILARWCQAPLLERKPKPMSAEDFDSIHKAAVGVKLHMMTEDGKEIHKLIKDSSEALKVSKAAETWKSYVDFVNSIVIEGLVSAVAVSLQYLCEILDPLIIARNEMQPLFDVKIELQDSEIVFEPAFTLTSGSQGSLCLRGVIDGWLKDFFAIGTVMQRLDSGTGDYLNELKEHFHMQCLLALVSELIDNTEMKCLEYRQKFLEHSFLWLDSIQDSFNNFLADGAKDLVENFEEEGVLHRLNEAIEACEKSLNDYLEQKKKAFPRFYFVANQALLDILSNGNRPLKVAEYLGDCFDGVKSLNFEKDPVNGRIGTGIISKDKEYVPFYEDVVLEGAVEAYLTNLESHIRCTLRDILDNARATAENWEVDKPREIWLQDYCAQLALVTTQLVWTEETARAFEELEGGSETAMKDYKRVCDDRIEKLIKQVVGEKGPSSWGLR
ncbi:hypothetical protein FOZ63_017584 [Perkinsus olseni]|uniref:Dynein heavy chain 1, axonemal n=1 Tax=Perkinsus olseni TaxID=32597 RepID=A0A7J6TCE0_PEROL|nr:hypothetical protein FOZ63_017584 [Perkinsus olseni]